MVERKPDKTTQEEVEQYLNLLGDSSLIEHEQLITKVVYKARHDRDPASAIRKEVDKLITGAENKSQRQLLRTIITNFIYGTHGANNVKGANGTDK